MLAGGFPDLITFHGFGHGDNLCFPGIGLNLGFSDSWIRFLVFLGLGRFSKDLDLNGTVFQDQKK